LTNYVRGIDSVEGRAAVRQIAERRVSVRRPLLSVGLIAQQQHGSVWWGGWAGHEPIARTNRRCHRSFSLRWDHGGSSDGD